MWGNSFSYANEDIQSCLTPGDLQSNDKAVKELFGKCMEGSWPCPHYTDVCLPGDKHKDLIGPEDDTYKACLNYKEESCCTSEFTQQLSLSDVTHIKDDTGIWRFFFLFFHK